MILPQVNMSDTVNIQSSLFLHGDRGIKNRFRSISHAATI